MRVLVGLGAVLLALVVWVWMAIMPETHSWRQKLTLVVETPTGEVTGSSVIEVRARFYGLTIGNEVEYDLSGEAAVIEVLPGRYLFALIGGSEELFHRAVNGRFLGKSRGEWLPEIPEQTKRAILADDVMPMLVTFDDITKPETVQEVDPGYLKAVFGEGVWLRAATLEITEEPVTEGRVESALPWLEPVGRERANLIGKPQTGRVSDQTNPGIYMISPADFSTELFK
jgi:hypothetical protein